MALQIIAVLRKNESETEIHGIRHRHIFRPADFNNRRPIRATRALELKNIPVFRASCLFFVFFREKISFDSIYKTEPIFKMEMNPAGTAAAVRPTAQRR